MKSFKNFYQILPETAQKQFKKEVIKACGFNDDQFYKKMRGATKILKPQSDVILKIAKRYSRIFMFARQLDRETDSVLYNEFES
jgi:hypothetical protein